MDDLLNMFTNPDQFKTNEGGFQDDNYIKKILHDGDNKFRGVGRAKVYYVHRFRAKNGVRVTSICPRDEDGNGSEDCLICQKVKTAWKIYNANEKAKEDRVQCEYTPAQVQTASVMVAKVRDPELGFPAGWGAKRTVAWNVIDREGDINAKEKHTSLLCKSEYDLGISAAKNGIYENVVQLLSRHRGEVRDHFEKGHDYLPFDMILIKSGKGIDTKYDKERCPTADLTEEEKNYTRYDLDKVVRVTDMKLVKKWLEKGTDKKDDKAKDTQAQDQGQPAQQTATQTEQAPAQTAQQPAQTQPPAQQTQQPAAEQPPAQEATQVAETDRQGGNGAAPAGDGAEMDNCPTCNNLIAISSTQCPHCKEQFAGYSAEQEGISADDIPF